MKDTTRRPRSRRHASKAVLSNTLRIGIQGSSRMPEMVSTGPQYKFSTIRLEDLFQLAFRPRKIDAGSIKAEQRFDQIVTRACHRGLGVRNLDIGRKSGSETVPRKGQFLHRQGQSFLGHRYLLGG